TCDGVSVCEGHGVEHREGGHSVTALMASAAPPPSTRCPRHPDKDTSHFSVTYAMTLCAACLAEPGTRGEVLALEAGETAISSLLTRLLAQCVEGRGAYAQSHSILSDATVAMVERTAASCERFVGVIDALKAMLDEARDAALRDIRRVCEDKVKVLAAQCDEMAVSGGQLEAGIGLGSAALASPSVLTRARCVEVLSGMTGLAAGASAPPRVAPVAQIVPDLTLFSQTVGSFIHLRTQSFNSSWSSVAGPRSGTFATGTEARARKHNVISVVCRTPSGAPLEGLLAGDVALEFRLSAGESAEGDGAVVAPHEAPSYDVVACGDPGEFAVSFIIPAEEVEKARVSVLLCGEVVGRPFTLTAVKLSAKATGEYKSKGRLVRSIPLPDDRYRFVAVNDEGSMVVAVRPDTSTLALFGLGVVRGPPSLFGVVGDRPGQFQNPGPVCFAPDGNLIVADNTRIQVVTPLGAHVRNIGLMTRMIEVHFGTLDYVRGPVRLPSAQHPVRKVWGLAMRGDLLAVGFETTIDAGDPYDAHKTKDEITVYSYSTVQIIHSVVALKNHVNVALESVCGGLAWSPDGSRLLFSLGSKHRMELVAVAGGKPQPAGVNLCGAAPYDVAFGNSGELVCVSKPEKVVRTFNATGSSLVKCRPLEDAAVVHGACVAGKRLFVLSRAAINLYN
ncbi:MAG: hypothetical protein P4L40_05360, partial [Terracidiphilus sp.]|nr:hypothetical protein [Terracidiphilus sp.]